MKNKILASIVTILALLILVSGCSVGGMLKKATGGAVDIDPKTGDIKVKTDDGDLEFGGGSKWNKDLTFGFAQPKGSKVEGYYKVQDTVTYSLSSLKRNELEKFYQNLLDAGFIEESFIDSGDTLVYGMVNEEKGQGIQINYDASSEEGGIIFIKTSDD